MNEKITELENKISQIRTEIITFTAKPLTTRITSELDILQKSKLFTELSYAIQTLFFSNQITIQTFLTTSFIQAQWK